MFGVRSGSWCEAEPVQIAERLRTLWLHAFAQGGARSIRSSVVVLVAVCVLPGSLTSALLISNNYKAQREDLIHETVATARDMMSAVDRDLASVESGLHVLAVSPMLASGDLEGFYQNAREAILSQNANSYVLVDESGRQLLNTLRPFGTPLPMSRAQPQLRQVFEKDATVVTDVFTGPVTGTSIVAIGVPAHRDGKVIYSVTCAIFPDRVAALLRNQGLPQGWIGAVFDRNGVLIAGAQESRSFADPMIFPELAKGAGAAAEGTLETTTLDGTPVVTAFSRSELSGWTVAVGIPKSALTSGLQQSLWLLIASTATLFSGGLWMAWNLGDRIANAIHGLIGPALELGSGKVVSVPPLHLKEADEVGQALIAASSRLLKAQYGAHYDVLTGLANRTLFDEILTQQLAISARDHSELSVLYLDIDGFKSVNDLYGHATGDDLLLAMATRIKSAVRASDVVARFGGDEFVVLLVQSGAESARAVAEKLVSVLSAVFEMHLMEVRISASIGIATFPASATSSAALLERADAAMYEAKKAGKNSYAIAEPLLTSASGPDEAALIESPVRSGW
jgi:diguanylate cyclase (GGDEF)-like protein